MSEERKKILEMLAAGKISADEAEKLLDALGEKSTDRNIESDTEKKKPKYMKIMVNSCGKKNGKSENVNIKIPLQVIRAGVKLGSILPEDAKEKLNSKLRDKGIDMNLKDTNIEELIESLCELKIDVEDDDEIVKIYCE
jgi:polyhydroxyalkanoate synthesis regulator phasin